MPKRYSRPHAGDRVQIDRLMDPSAMKVAQGLHQFTAIDDCTRLRVQAAPMVLGIYPDKTGASAAHFFAERVLKEFPFPIERIQTAITDDCLDRGSEFISHELMGALRQAKVKLRPNRPRSPHLNGKVERSEQTDRMESGLSLR